MEDDEDLEFLRLAALKSLNAKKENVGSAIEVVENVLSAAASLQQKPAILQRSHPQPYYHLTPPLVAPEGRNIPCINYNGEIIDKLDLNEPYVPQRLAGNGQWIDNSVNEYIPYVPAKIVSNQPNVQLSPRSAAFVSQNNDILMRRKGGHSPDSPRSPQSPIGRHSPGRWSESPPPMSKHLSNRSPNWDCRRSTSRSPLSNRDRRSPIKHQILSRSPPLLPSRKYSSRSPPKHVNTRSPQRYRPRHSPPLLRRSMSRSPQRNFSNNSGRPSSRSPPQIPPLMSSGMYARRPSPTNNLRQNNKNYNNKWRGYSPNNHYNNSNRRKSPSPRLGPSGGTSTGSPYRPTTRRRTRSPDNNFGDPSRSPSRKYARSNNRDRSTGINQSNKRRSSPPINQTRKYGARNAGNGRNKMTNNRTRPPNTLTKRSPSPTMRRKLSKSKSPVIGQHTSLNESLDKLTIPDKSDETLRDAKKPHDNRVIDKKQEDTKNDLKQVETKAKTEDELENELLQLTDDDAEDDSSVENDDGIDLFASEESESENEGRFKSSSSRNERTTNVATVSFSKLGSSSASTVHDLDDVKSSDRNTTNRKERDDRYGGRNGGGGGRNYSNRRDERFRKSDNRPSNSSSNRHTSSSSSYYSKPKILSTASATNTISKDDKRKDEKSMFKSTFQSVEPIESSKNVVADSIAKSTIKSAAAVAVPTAPAEPIVSNKVKQQSERKNVITLKRSAAVSSNDEKDGSMKSTPLASAVASNVTSTNTASTSSASTVAAADTDDATSTKKPIHLRLGAMTKTWKNKKSWRTEKL